MTPDHSEGLSRQGTGDLTVIEDGEGGAGFHPSHRTLALTIPHEGVVASLRKEQHVLLASPGGHRGRGGMATLLRYLADALPGHIPGVTIDVLDTYGPGRFWAVPGTFAAASLKLIVARLRGRADLLHIHMSSYGSALRKGFLALIATSLSVTTIMHLHGSDFDEFFWALRPWQRKLLVAVLRRCSRVIVIGSHWREFVVGEVGLEPERVVLIHNGAPASPSPFAKAPGQKPKLLMLGELGPRKGTPELVAALATPEVRQMPWVATLAGNGFVNRFRDQIASLNLSDRVYLPGWQTAEQVHDLLDAADILFLPSHHEGLPMAILEAMASGVAVVASPVGAIPDAIVDGESGLLVPCGDVDALSKAILRLLRDPALRQRLASNARARFERLFTIDRTAAAVATVYRELGIGLAGGGPGTLQVKRADQ